MWEKENLQIWAPSQNLRAAKCHSRADVKQVKKNRCVNDRTGGKGSFLLLSLLYSVRLCLGFLIKFVIIKMKSKQPLTFTCKTSKQIIEPPSCHAVPGPCRSHMSHFSQTHLTFSLCKQCCINPQLYTKQLLFCHVYSHKIAPVLGVNSMM